MAVAVISTVLLAVVSAESTAADHSRVRVEAKLTASGGWLARFNAWRASSRLSQLVENATWSTGDYDHAVYMVKNDLVTHYETLGTPYYTTDGDTAARNSNIYVSSSTATSDEQAIDWWMQAPFHAMGMMDPRLTQTGAKRRLAPAAAYRRESHLFEHILANDIAHVHTASTRGAGTGPAASGFARTGDRHPVHALGFFAANVTARG